MTRIIKSLRFLLFILLVVCMFVFFLRTPQIGRLFYPYPYRQIIEKYGMEYGIDPLLVVAVIHTESKFNPEAVSRKGALGLMQIMPSTANWIAQQLQLAPLTKEEIMEPEINIRLGTWYLASLTKEFNGRLDVVIAAYNGGRGEVGRWLANGVWSGKFTDRQAIPFPETREFLYKVRTAYRRYQELYR
ncbi:MAG: lytic transglycosylase domain-containing protein [Firmicutes bacterium]|nr:lytic transglycosylase domain-containing protein [Bacillota bacterium]